MNVKVEPSSTTTPEENVAIATCPKCKVGVLKDDYSCCALCLAIFCFPCGIICCLAMGEKECINCQERF